VAAFSHEITAYEAVYMAIAEATDSRLLTYDRELQQYSWESKPGHQGDKLGGTEVV